ncbi:methyl-accepting chemotaxis protein [Pseudomonas sp. PCH446]
MFHWLTRALRDRSIRFKLALGFGLVLLLTLAVTLTGWHALGTTIERSHTLSSIARLSRLTSDMRADRIAFRVLNDPQSRIRITRQLTSIEKLLATLLPRLTDPGERQILTDQQRATQGFQTTLDDLDENPRDRDRARKRMNAGLVQATQAVARFAAHQLREASKSPTHSSGRPRSNRQKNCANWSMTPTPACRHRPTCPIRCKPIRSRR